MSRAIGILLLGVLACTGCGPSGGSGDGGVPPAASPGSSVDEATIREYSRDWCSLYQRCGVPTYRDLEGCIDALSCGVRGILPGSSITREQLLACSRSIVGLACDSPMPSPTHTACMQLSGSVSEAFGMDLGCGGETCGAGAFCDRSDELCPRCVERAALGESCVGTRCAVDGYCRISTQRCEPVLDEGMPCEEHSACQHRGTIGPAAWRICRNGVCATPAELGEPCEQVSDCVASLTCRDNVCSELGAAGAACTGGPRECQPYHGCIRGSCTELCGFRSQGLGEACLFDLHCDDSYCDPQTSLCTALQPDGAACGTSAECEAEHYCDPSAAACARKLEDGAACAIDGACASAFCDDQRCQPPTCN